MPLLRLIDLCLRYQRGPLLDHVSAVIHENERIALLGRNGAGKSSLFKILCHEVQADKGEMELQAGVKIARLQQEVPDNIDSDVFSVVEGEPLSAKVVCKRFREFQRGDWRVDITTHSTMSCDAEYFYLVNQVTTREGESIVFEQTWEKAISRDKLRVIRNTTICQS